MCILIYNCAIPILNALLDTKHPSGRAKKLQPERLEVNKSGILTFYQAALPEL